MNFEFADGDDYHSEENKTLMRNGIGLNDDLRLNWLLCLRHLLVEWHLKNKNGILACSALKQIYRHLLNSNLSYNNNQTGSKDSINLDLIFIMLDFERLVIESRLNQRSNHDIIKNLKILDSQFETLEKPYLNDDDSTSTIRMFKNSYLTRETFMTNKHHSYLILVYKDESDCSDSVDFITDNLIGFLNNIYSKTLIV